MTRGRPLRTRAPALSALLLALVAALTTVPGVSARATTSDPGAATGEVSGTVTSPEPLFSARLLTQRDGVWTADGTEPQDDVGDQGRFDITGVPVGGNYRLCFTAVDPVTGLNAPAGCYGGTFPEDATRVAVDGGSQQIDVTLSDTLATVTGSVVAPNGGPAPCVVRLERETGSGWEADASNGPDGTGGQYRFSVLPATYRIRVEPEDPNAATSVSSPITVTSDQTLPAQTTAAARVVSGLVTGPAGPVPGVDVRAVDATGAVLGTTRTDDAGRYSLSHVPQGSVSLRAAATEDSTPLQISVPVAVPAGSADVTQNIVLQRGATFTGTVVDADQPDSLAQVRAWDPTGSSPVRTADVSADGSFTLGGLTPGVSYDVAVDPRDGRDVRYLTAAADVTLTADQAATFPAGTSLGFVDLLGLQGTVPAPTATVSGSATVGSTVSVTASWPRTPRPDLVRYTWYSGGTVVSGPAVGNTSYVVRSSDVGGAISVLVTGALSGYRTSRTQLVAGVVPARPAPPTATPSLTVTRSPGVLGQAKVGRRLSASTGSASPASSVSVQWLRNGAPIPQATGTSYKLTKADKGRRISVRVLYARAGYRPVSATSPTTRAVAK